MSERGIIMQAESVRGILDDRKTQTRRLAKPEEFGAQTWDQLPSDLAACWTRNARPRHPRYGEAGDRLWIKEVWQAWRQTSVEYDEWEPEEDGERIRDSRIEYRATSTSTGPWRTPLFMPRWASRITLEITDVRVERLQAITEDDARAEGCGRLGTHVDAYAMIWNEINFKRAPWASNPWVWPLTFRRLP